MFAPRQPGDMERSRWQHIPRDLEGRIVSLAELQHYFPENNVYHSVTTVTEKDEYKELGRRRKGNRPYPEVCGYQCKKCNTIIIGSPRIQDDMSLHDPNTPPLSGREGYDLYCHNPECQHHLAEHTDAQS